MRGCGRGGAFAESDEGGDECGGGEGGGALWGGGGGEGLWVVGEGLWRRVMREETNAWVWKGRGLCGEW